MKCIWKDSWKNKNKSGEREADKKYLILFSVFSFFVYVLTSFKKRAPTNLSVLSTNEICYLQFARKEIENKMKKIKKKLKRIDK